MQTKIIFFFAAFLIAFNLSAKKELLLEHTWILIEDKLDESIPEGTCVVKGRVYESYTANAVGGGLISNLSGSKTTHTNTEGDFKLTISDKDSVIYFYHEFYGEIICKGYDFKSQHMVTIEFITRSESYDEPIMVEKPVIYLYSEENEKVNLSLQNTGEMVFTYPEYKNGWEVETSANGDLKCNGSSYPYLFWEAKRDKAFLNSLYPLGEKFTINTDSTVSFLENQLELYGLNSRERTDFITYWAPRLIQRGGAVTVQFLIDDLYDDNIAGITMNPKPDAIRRVFMIVRDAEEIPENYNYSTIKPFVRKGLVCVEWGGAEL